jgi:hypothetical protein
MFLITQGLGMTGDGTGSGLLVTGGLGSTGTPDLPACLALRVLAVENWTTYLICTFSNTLLVDGPALLPENWVISGPSTVRVTSVEVLSPGHLVKLGITRQTNNASYTLKVPTQGISDINGNLVSGPYQATFTGIGTPLTVQFARSVDERTLDIVFSLAVTEADAVIPGNYTITGGSVTVTKATRITDLYYRLQTTPQDINVNYQVGISNIRDSNGNL